MLSEIAKSVEIVIILGKTAIRRHKFAQKTKFFYKSA